MEGNAAAVAGSIMEGGSTCRQRVSSEPSDTLRTASPSKMNANAAKPDMVKEENG